MASRVKKRTDTATNRESDKIITRLPEGMRADLAKLARQTGRSVTAEVVRALTNHVNLELGIKPAGENEGYLLSEHGLYQISKRLEAGVRGLEQLYSDARNQIKGKPSQRNDWKGFLRLSLVTCPVALYPAAAENDDGGIDLANDASIDIFRFLPRGEVDPLYVMQSYYLVPDGDATHDAFAVIRETLRATDNVAIADVSLANHQKRLIAIDARGKGMVGLLLRRSSEVRDPTERFSGGNDLNITQDMIALARHIVESKYSNRFDPHELEALIGQPSPAEPATNVIDLMDALQQSKRRALRAR